MSGDVLNLREIDQSQVAAVGGKGARLGELAWIEGVRVPAGFCVSTDAFRRISANAPMMDEALDRLALLHPADRTRSGQSVPTSVRPLRRSTFPAS